eukprot:c20793_g3_i1.p1 GENE.c20793_g3_i1~~c20793_g3_i1.p1  ORF type:complete len:106 (-),score=7.24 c20793_g3_i1:711-1028(-)
MITMECILFNGTPFGRDSDGVHLFETHSPLEVVSISDTNTSCGQSEHIAFTCRGSFSPRETNKQTNPLFHKYAIFVLESIFDGIHVAFERQGPEWQTCDNPRILE